MTQACPIQPETETGAPVAILRGQVSSGRGLGSGVVMGSREKIAALLGAEPFPGTLNVVLDEPFVLKGGVQLDVKGKQFAVPARINGVPCLFYRWRGAPLHVAEIIAAVSLRKAAQVQDGVTVTLELPPSSVMAPAPWRAWLWKVFYAGRTGAYYDDGMHKVFRPLKFFHKKICQRAF
jgi:hypothetical protein